MNVDLWLKGGVETLIERIKDERWRGRRDKFCVASSMRLSI